MGFLKDMRSIQKTAKDMTPPEHRGVMGGFRAMKDLAATGANVLGDMQAQNATGQHLMANGRQGTATVTAIRDTGLTVNENPQVELDLQVTVDGGAPYAVNAPPGRLARGDHRPSSRARRCPSAWTPRTPHTLLIA